MIPLAALLALLYLLARAGARHTTVERRKRVAEQYAAQDAQMNEVVDRLREDGGA